MEVYESYMPLQGTAARSFEANAIHSHNPFCLPLQHTKLSGTVQPDYGPRLAKICRTGAEV